MGYLTVKALHIIFVVTWFAGLFYIVRLFIYQREALEKPEIEKKILYPLLSLMARRLWFGITWPSAILTLVFGTTLIIKQPIWLEQPFMHIKLTFVLLLLIYQIVCQRLFSKLQAGIPVWTSQKLRFWNELATIILVAIVFLIVLKNSTDWLYGTLGLVIFATVLVLAIQLYKKSRK